MIYDCFTFYNELDLLELRLNTLSKHVDYFVIVEATTTFSGKPKPLFYQQNKKRFASFKHQIIHVVVEDLESPPNIINQPPYNQFDLFQQNPSTWSREFYQRNCITRGLSHAADKDLILIGDVDEIPNYDKLKLVKFSKKPTIFEQDFYYYYLNCLSPENKINGTRGVYKKYLTTPQEIRIKDQKSSYVIKNGGWHFSYLGGYTNIVKKIKSFSHQELNTPDINNLHRLKFNIDNNLDIFDRPFSYKIVKVDHKFPQYIYKNLSKFKKYIKPVKKITPNVLLLQQEILSNRKKLSNPTDYQKIISNKDGEIQQLKLTLSNREATLQTIYLSKTWKFFLIYQKLKNLAKALHHRF